MPFCRSTVFFCISSSFRHLSSNQLVCFYFTWHIFNNCQQFFLLAPEERSCLVPCAAAWRTNVGNTFLQHSQRKGKQSNIERRRRKTAPANKIYTTVIIHYPCQMLWPAMPGLVPCKLHGIGIQFGSCVCFRCVCIPHLQLSGSFINFLLAAQTVLYPIQTTCIYVDVCVCALHSIKKSMGRTKKKKEKIWSAT